MINACCFDLETTGLNADFGIILCAVIKEAGKKPIVFRADKTCKTWKTKRSDDSDIVKAIASELSKYDILIAHNGVCYDLPFLRTRLAKHGLPFFPNKKVIDPVLIARRALRMSGNGLEKICSLLGFNMKTRVDGQLWMKASLDGDVSAMNYIVDHCVADVDMLEKMVDYLKPYCTSFNPWGSSN